MVKKPKIDKTKQPAKKSKQTPNYPMSSQFYYPEDSRRQYEQQYYGRPPYPTSYPQYPLYPQFFWLCKFWFCYLFHLA